MKLIDAVYVYKMRSEKEKEHHQRLHSHKPGQLELHYFVSGSGTFINGKYRFSIVPNSLFITFDNKAHQIISEGELTYYAILLEYDEECKPLFQLETKNPFIVREDTCFLFEDIRDKGMSENEALNQSACFSVLSLLFFLLGRGDVSTVRNENIYIAKSLSFMRDKLYTHLTLSDIATEVGLNSSYFVRLFRKELKQTPLKYFSSMQMEAARGLLSSTTLSIKEIADKFSYCSEFHFSARFKENTGLTPSEYRKNYLQII